MKFRKTKTPVIATRIVDKELSDYIKQQDLINIEKSKELATKLSVLNFKVMPPTSSIEDFIGVMLALYQHLIDYTNTRLSGDLQKLKGSSEISDSKEASLELDRKIDAVNKKLNPKKGKFDDKGKQHETEVKRWFRWFMPLLILIAGMEFIANFDALNVGGSRLSSLGLAILAGISIYWYAHFVPGKIEKYGGKSNRRKLFLFLLSILPIIIVFYYFSTMRLQYLAALNPELMHLYNTNPFLMTITNVFAYVISCFIIKAYKPDKETILAYKKYKEDVKDIAVLENELETLQTAKAGLTPKLRNQLAERYNILLLGKQTEQEIVTRLQNCFEEFKMELFLKTNGECAPLFSGNPSKDIPKLNLNYEDIHQKFEEQ